MCLNPISKIIAVYSEDKKIFILKVSNENKIDKSEIITDGNTNINYLFISYDESYIIYWDSLQVELDG